MFKIAPWFNNFQAPAVLMIDDLSDAYIDVYEESYKNDWGYLGDQEGSAFHFLEKELLDLYPDVKITFFVPYLRHEVLNENCGFSVKKYALGERKEYTLFLKRLVSKGHEIAHHGSDHGRYINRSICTTANNWIHEWALFQDVEEGVEITEKGVKLFKTIANIDVVGGKYCGYITIDNSQEIIDSCNFLYWCEHVNYLSHDFDETFFGKSQIFSFPTNFPGNSFVRLAYLTGDPKRDSKKKYAKNFQPLYNLLSYYKLDQLYKQGKIISIQDHISPSTSAGTAQSANIVSDILSLKKIFAFLKSRSVWYATCEEIAEYVYIKHNCTIQEDNTKIIIDFKNSKHLSNTFISLTHDKAFTLHQNNVKHSSKMLNGSHTVTVSISNGKNEFDYTVANTSVKKVLLAGPLENKHDVTKTGGVIVLFSDLLRQFDKQGIEYHVIDTNKANYSNKPTALLSIWYNLLTKTKQYPHLSLHATANDYMFIAPLAVFIAKALGKTVSLRKFAGSFDDIYEKMNFLLKPIVSMTLKKSDANFFETHYLVNHFLPLNKSTHWLPNVRERPDQIRTGEFRKRFIFIGSVTKEKGIIELLEASNQLGSDYTVHIYGNISDDLLDFDFSNYKAEYKGALKSPEVLKTLREYDVLILPSYIEGYPGVIIEALSIGLPIIATTLKGIKEMVDESCTVFVAPKNTPELKNAILHFDQTNYPEFSYHACQHFEKFDSEIQTAKFINIIQ
ncbi:MAG: glycosyltransferase [Pseudomonadota bacterium]